MTLARLELGWSLICSSHPIELIGVQTSNRNESNAALENRPSIPKWRAPFHTDIVPYESWEWDVVAELVIRFRRRLVDDEKLVSKMQAEAIRGCMRNYRIDGFDQ